MSSARVERVKRQLLREVTTILKEDLKDPRIGFVTVMQADLSPDMRNAKIFVSIMGTPEEQAETFQVLTHAAGFIRIQIGHRMRLRYTPEILFVKDESIVHVDRVLQLLNEIKTKESPHD